MNQPNAPEPRFASALTRASDPQRAGIELIDQIAAAELPEVHLLVIFFTQHHVAQIDTIRDRIRDALEPQSLLGMSVCGVVFGAQEIEEEPAITVLAANLPGCRLQPFSFQQIGWGDDQGDPEVLAEELNLEIDGSQQLSLLMADPFSTPLIKTLPALQKLISPAEVVGGLASGARRPRKNRLLIDDQVLNEGAIGCILSGHVAAKTTVSQGCRPVGKPYIITKSKRHIVQELGGQNALDAIKGMVGELEPDDQQLVEGNGLLIGRVVNEYKKRFGPGDFVIRGLVGVDQDAGYVAVGDPQVTVGQTVQFHVRDQKAASDDFDLLLETQRLYGPAAGGLMFTCTGRGINLYDQPDVDAQLAYAALEEPPLVGCFAAGEIGPVGGRALVHGHTVVLTAFRAFESL
ncbi:FIST signal transduction protein [Mucisphaera sp.]|uniref:FIST signal transduction protein n=1 Tax=Mucisphaera sp. TaxID=2913024 RepID=UPI003D0ED846